MASATLLVSRPLALFAQSSHADRARSFNKNDIVIENNSVHIRYHIGTGTMDVVWNNGYELLGVASGTTLAGTCSVEKNVDGDRKESDEHDHRGNDGKSRVIAG